MISKSSEIAEDSAIEEKYLIATSEQPIAAYHRCVLQCQLMVHSHSQDFLTGRSFWPSNGMFRVGI